ncbi:MAG: DivIVA domain-containing protein [Lachnospiraceae bacterium]|nr:DivIVA domain-containing protein [Lachnospiraceae bacterium]
MLTPVEIQNKAFKVLGLGYDKKDVDSFLEDVVDSYEEVYRDKVELEDKVSELEEALNHYRAIEKTMQKALILAEKTAEETKANAIENARQIENDAVTKSQIILSDARRELEKINQQIINMNQTFETYKINFKNLANAQIELINSESFNISASLLNADGIAVPKKFYDKKEERNANAAKKEKKSDEDIEFIGGETDK